MRKFWTLTIALLLLTIGLIPTFAQNNDILGTASADPSFSTFVAAVEAAGLTDALSEPGPFTVFAPTNDAFNNLLNSVGLTAEELLADTELLTTLLTFHVLAPQPAVDVNGNGVSKTELRNAYAAQTDGVLEVGMLSGEQLTLQLTVDDTIIMNSQRISVNVEDLFASNGVIHAINGVLLPPSLRLENGLPNFGNPVTTVDFLAQDPASFSSFVDALNSTGLADVLADTSQEYTVFAPTNDALANAQNALADADLTEILSLHILPGRFSLQDIETAILTSGTRFAAFETLNGGQITAQIDADGNVLLNGQGITVTLTDLNVSNATIHYIPGVVLPNDTQSVVSFVNGDSSFSILEQALVATGLDEVLADLDSEFTLFAPTDDAMANFLTRTGLTAEDLLADTELLTTILQYHVLPGQQSANTITNAYSAASSDVLTVDTVGGEPLTVQIDPNGVILLTGNGTTVGVPDIFAQNGVIHAVPAVLIPPSLLDDNGRPTFGNLSTVVDFVANSPDFSILASLLAEQGLVEALSDTSADFTVFAPTNGAFQAAQGTLDTLSAEQVVSALTFHVVPGRYTAADLRALYDAEVDGVLELETLSGETLTIQVQPDGTILLNGQGITVFLTDQTRDNGIIHGIPAVMIPPSLQ